MTKIHIMALRHSAFYSPLLMTMAGGFLREEGLEADYMLATPEHKVEDRIRRGQCHVAQSAVATSFSLLEQGQRIDIVHFAQINQRDGFFIAAREAMENFRWEDLKGKRVLVDHFFQPMAMLKYGLHQQGISFDDFTVMDAGDVTAIDKAFRRGEADFVHQQGPAPQQIEQDGMGYVVGSVGELVGPVAFSSLCADRHWLKTDMAQAFVRAYQKSCDYVCSAPAEDIARAEQDFFQHIELPVLTATIRAYQQMGCWQTDIAIPEAAYQRLLDVFMFNQLIHKPWDYQQVIVAPPAV